MIIEDGSGNGPSAAVTVNNRLMTTGVDLSLDEKATETGDTYNINTSEVSLTTNVESSLLYVKNNEESTLIITGFFVNIRDFVGTDSQPTFKVYRKPSAGTLISSATPAISTNRNYGSSKTLDADVFEGVNGSTITAQDIVLPIYLPTTAAVTFVPFNTIVALPKGASIGLSYVPPSGITSVTIVVGVTAILNGTQL